MSPALEWLRAHALAAWPALSLILILALRTRTPEAWVALGERQPRVQGLIRALRAVGLDPVKLVAGLAQLVTGRAPVDPREAELSQLRTELAALQRRVSESHAVTQPQGLAHPAQIFAPVFDPSVRQTIVPEVAAKLPREGERGSVDVRALLAVVVALSVVLPLGVALSGCPRNPPVSGCQPEAQTCINDRPSVCSASQRWHVAGDRSCASVGGVCTVLGGRAYCGPVVDAGADVGDAE